MDIFNQSLSESKDKVYNDYTIEDFETEFKDQFYDAAISSRKEKIEWQKDLITKFNNKASDLTSAMMQELSVKEAISKIFNSSKVLRDFRVYAASKTTSKKTQIYYIEKKIRKYPELDMERYNIGELKYNIPMLEEGFKSVLDIYLDEKYWLKNGPIEAITFNKYKDYENKEKLIKLFEKNSKYFHKTDNLKPSEIIKLSNLYDKEISKDLKQVKDYHDECIDHIGEVRNKVNSLFIKLLKENLDDKKLSKRLRQTHQRFINDSLHYTSIINTNIFAAMTFYIKYYKETSRVIHKIFMEIEAFNK
jgi:hypothetical protein